MAADQDGWGNTPWGGNIIPGVTPSDGYGPMGWGNSGDVSQSVKYEAEEPVGSLVHGHNDHLARGHNSHRRQL